MSEGHDIPFSRRVQRIGRSATMAAGEKAARLVARGIDVVDLGPGLPDFDTPEHIREAGERAIADGHTRYTPIAGILQLREAVAQMYERRDGAELSPEQVIITSGGKQAIHNAIEVLVDHGDEVIVPTPFWVSFPEQIRLAGGVPVFVDTSESDGFVLRAEQVAAACTDRTKVVVINTPSNPSGAVLPGEQVEAFVELAAERSLMLLFDECYDRFVYDGGVHVSPLSFGRPGLERSVICGSCSKTFAMTGWRIGYAAGSRSLIDAMARLQSHTTSNATSVSQWAALAALIGDQEPVRRMLEEFSRRREMVLPRIERLPGVGCATPGGAFYAFPNISELLSDKLPTSVDLASHLIDHARVVTVAGAAFGRDGYLRLSFATSVERLAEGLERLESACSELAKLN